MNHIIIKILRISAVLAVLSGAVIVSNHRAAASIATMAAKNAPLPDRPASEKSAIPATHNTQNGAYKVFLPLVGRNMCTIQEIEIEPNDSLPQATWMCSYQSMLDKPMIGYFIAGDVDIFAVFLEAGNQLTLNLHPDTAAIGVSSISLYLPPGTGMPVYDGTYPYTIDFSITETGVYYLKPETSHPGPSQAWYMLQVIVTSL